MPAPPRNAPRRNAIIMEDEKTLQDAAVLVPVFRARDGELRVVLVRRTETGIHGGQIAFPGGKRASDDEPLLQTALREANEEIGLETELVTVLGELTVVETSVSGFRIQPFLARIQPPARWRLQKREIAEIFEAKIGDLLEPASHGEEEWRLPGWPAPRKIRFYRVGGRKLWGATYRILHPLLPRLMAGDWDL